MALLPRGLCAVLILWLAITRPPAANPPESPDSAPWWVALYFSDLQAESRKLRVAGDYPALERLYESAIERSRRLGLLPAETTYLLALANTYVLRFRYPEALELYRSARSLAVNERLWDLAVAAAPGLSSMYEFVGDEDAALEAIRQGMEAARRQSVARPELFVQKARLERGDVNAAREAIVASRGASPSLEATAWDILSDRLLEAGDLDAAQEAVAAGLRLRRKAGKELHFSYWRLANLRLARSRREEAPFRDRLLDSAERFNGMASTLAREFEKPLLHHQLGLVEQARQRPQAALEHFRAAVQSSRRWASMPLSASSLAASDRKIREDILRSFVETAASRSVAAGDADLARESFLATEQYRAASLRQTRDLASVWRAKLPQRYWMALGELGAAEAAQIERGVSNETVDRLRLEISEMEAYASIGLSLNQTENFLAQTSLIHFQHGLSRDELLLSFHLGERESFLWAVTREGLQIYSLPASERIASRAAVFREAVLGHRAEEVSAVGRELYGLLFGQLSPAEVTKGSWLLSLEGTLFELPFAALRAGAGDDELEFLVQRHTLQVVPGALLLGQRSGAPGDRYLAVGDAVYNAADPRYEGPREGASSGLNRLAASAGEIHRSAAAWDGPAELLVGPAATRDQILQSVDRSAPGALHLSTHVVRSTNGERAFLALSLGADAAPQLLTAADAALFNVPGSLVVMTGCASGTGEAVPGAGLLGLTRGWLVAGASAVVATSWPVADVSGDVIPHFFGSLRSSSPAAALRRSQIEAIQSTTWQKDPAYWASFQVTGGGR